MIKISAKTLLDLEFPTVRGQVEHFCITSAGKEKALEIVPFKTAEETLFSLHQTNEYVSSYQNESPVPNHGFDVITNEIKLLGIQDTRLEAQSFKKIAAISETVNIQIKFFRKFEELYPALFETTSKVTYTTELLERINRIIDKYGDVKDDASPLLQTTRQAMNSVKTKVNSSFGSALTSYNSAGYLDEIRESVVENIRVLAVSAMYRKKVKGSILGSSKTGSIVYIQP